MGKFEIFSTTADVGIRVSGRDLEDLFKSAVSGLNRLLFDKKFPPTIGPTSYHFEYLGDSAENILVNLLSEILFQVQVHGKITADIRIIGAGENRLSADLLLVDSDLELEVDIKSVTYHNLKIIEKKGIKYAEVIFDI
jgi:SHS2 domain-containing protein